MLVSLKVKRRTDALLLIFMTIACGGFALIAGTQSWVPYHKIISKVGIGFLGLSLAFIFLILIINAHHHGFFKGSLKYYRLHSKIERQLEEQLTDAGIYVKRYSGQTEVAVLPKVKIVFGEDLLTGEITIQRRLKDGRKLDEFDISPALGNYIVEQSFISKDGNFFQYDIFDADYDRQLVFSNTEEYIKACKSEDGYLLTIDAITKIPLFHALISGGTGSGKSYLLCILILQMLSKLINYVLWLADPKRSGLAVVGRAISPERTADTLDEIIELLRNFHKEMIERMSIMKSNLAQSDKVDADYRDFGLEPHVFIFDEYLAFSKGISRYEKKVRDEVDSILSDVVLMGRQLGFFLWLTMQSSPATEIPTFIRAQLGWKVVLGNADRSTYTVAFDTSSDVPVMKFPIGYGLYTYTGITEKPKILAAPTIKNFDILDAVKKMK